VRIDDAVVQWSAPEKWSSLKYGFQAEWRTRE
jgi:hypothetical protein